MHQEAPPLQGYMLSTLDDDTAVQLAREHPTLVASVCDTFDEAQRTILEDRIFAAKPVTNEVIGKRIGTGTEGARRKVLRTRTLFRERLIECEYLRRVQSDEITDHSQVPLDAILPQLSRRWFASRPENTLADLEKMTVADFNTANLGGKAPKVLAEVQRVMTRFEVSLAGTADISQEEISSGTVRERPIGDLNLSTRALKAARRLKINFIGDFSRLTEAQVLAEAGTKTFAVIRDKLAAVNVSFATAANLSQLPEDERLDKPIVSLGLSTRPSNTCAILELTTIRELTRQSADDLLECKNCGLTALNEIRDKLQAAGLKLRGD